MSADNGIYILRSKTPKHARWLKLAEAAEAILAETGGDEESPGLIGPISRDVAFALEALRDTANGDPVRWEFRVEYINGDPTPGHFRDSKVYNTRKEAWEAAMLLSDGADTEYGVREISWEKD